MEFTLENTCCFTGHRPDKLPWGYDESDAQCLALKQRIFDAIVSVYDQGIRKYICGMALGCDMYFGEEVIRLMSDHPEVSLEAAVPFAGHADHLSHPNRERYDAILRHCSKVSVLCPRYLPGCMHQRNRYMVENAGYLIAVYNDTPGGTRFTVELARSKGRQIILLAP